jgi:hypothetical protein
MARETSWKDLIETMGDSLAAEHERLLRDAAHSSQLERAALVALIVLVEEEASLELASTIQLAQVSHAPEYAWP